MTVDARTAIMDGLFKECLEMAGSKGRDYSGQTDTLANFKRNAERLGMTPFQVWAVYAAKHIDSIFNAIAEDPHAPKTHSEPIHGRIVDTITYLTLLECLLEETNK